jgi:hypothetical protein
MRQVLMLSLVFVALVPIPSTAQSPTSPRYRVISTNRFSTLQTELAQAAAEGYRVRATMRPADAARAIVLERSPDKREYFVSSGVERDLRDGKVPSGYVILPHTLGVIGGGPCGAVFERDPSATAPAYRIESAVSPNNLQKDILTAIGKGDRVRMIGAAAGYCALLESGGTAGASATAAADGKEKAIELIATSRTATLEKELAAAAARGFRLHSAAAADEYIFLMERQEAAGPPPDYLVISTSKAETLQGEMNQASAKGYHLHPFSLIGKTRGLTATLEITVVMEKRDRPPVEYRVLSTARAASFEKELVESAEQGWQLVATLPYGAFSAVMERPAAR